MVTRNLQKNTNAWIVVIVRRAAQSEYFIYLLIFKAYRYWKARTPRQLSLLSINSAWNSSLLIFLRFSCFKSFASRARSSRSSSLNVCLCFLCFFRNSLLAFRFSRFISRSLLFDQGVEFFREVRLFLKSRAQASSLCSCNRFSRCFSRALSW